MKTCMSGLACVLLGLMVVAFGNPQLNAQIVNEIRAHIDHSFVIDNTTLPPGDYTFRMVQNSGLSAMTATSDTDKTSVTFAVRRAQDDHTPRHSEVTFRKYGDTEFLDKVFESGTKSGVATTETARAEQDLVNQGHHPTEHTEEQQ